MGADEKRFRIINAAQLTIEPYCWLIEGILPARGVTLLYGDSNVYKTFLGISMTAAVAAKPSWMGYQTQKAVSLYIATEGYDIPIRHRGWQIMHGVHVPHDANYIIEDLSLYDPVTMRLLIERIKEQGIRPGLITVDILADAILPGNEIDNKDMSIFTGNFKTLINEFDAAGLLVHHTGKDGLRERGASALRPKLEASYKITEGKGIRNVSMVCDKMKSGQKPKQLILHLE